MKIKIHVEIKIWKIQLEYFDCYLREILKQEDDTFLGLNLLSSTFRILNLYNNVTSAVTTPITIATIT